jgi:4-amino-4-deoxy-L-arabinose transferase-like glycosyltransferase
MTCQTFCLKWAIEVNSASASNQGTAQMDSAFASSHHLTSDRAYNWLTGGALVMITTLRSAALITTPLGLGVDEAQYWLWSQTPDFGYFTKPPLVAWIISLAHWIFGHHTWAVRLPACWIHLTTALLLWRGAAWLYNQRAGRLAALIWISLPAVGLGSFLISTDTPLLALWSLGLLALCGIVSGRLSPPVGMVLAGLSFGAAMLAKFAAIYALVGLVLILLHDRITRQQLIGWRDFGLALIAFSLAASPTIIWNFANEFSTVRHLSDNASISHQSASIFGIFQFIGAQFAVVGPVMFLFMATAAVRQWHDRKTKLLVWMSAPVLSLMIVQSYLSEANANWAMTAFPALTMLAAGWLSKIQKRRYSIIAIGVNFVLSLLVLSVTVAGSMGPLTPKSDPLRRLRGWQLLAADIVPHIATHDASVIIADRRATASLLNWHFYGTNLKILVHDIDGIPSNHFEANHSWSPQAGRRLIALTGGDAPPALSGVRWIKPTGTSRVTISQNKHRQFTIFRGIE